MINQAEQDYCFFINRLLSGLGIYYNITTAGNPYENSFAPPAPAAIPT